MSDRRKLRYRVAFAKTGKAPHPIENSWNGQYRQRINLTNSENKTDIVCDFSRVEIEYLIEILQEAQGQLLGRMTGEEQERWVDLCEHGKGMADYCEPCGRIHSN